MIILSGGFTVRRETEQKTKGMSTEGRVRHENSNKSFRNSTAPPAVSHVHCSLSSSLFVPRVTFHSMHDLQVRSRVPLKSHNKDSDKGLYNSFKAGKTTGLFKSILQFEGHSTDFTHSVQFISSEVNRCRTITLLIFVALSFQTGVVGF